MKPKFHNEMRDAISNVLETMFFVAPLFEEEGHAPCQFTPYRFEARIGMVGDSESYEISFRSTEGFARMITANFLGLVEEVVTTEQMADAMKELANMTVGDLLTRGGDWSRMKLGIPSIESDEAGDGKDVRGGELFRLQLSCEGEPLTVRIWPRDM